MSAHKDQLKLELFTDAALCALEYLTTPNPCADLEKLRTRAISQLKDALEVSGLRALEFEIKSDKN